MTPATLTLTEFLLARIAEDEERHARDLVGREYGYGHARMLAECEAKRRIVEMWGDRSSLTIAVLAAIYSDHPDYREEWRP